MTVFDYDGQLNGKRFLVVDDSDLSREVLADILSDEACFVEEAFNGQEAVNLLREKGPDYYSAVLMDISMPVMDGHEATRIIRRMYPNHHVPVIAVSSYFTDEDIDKSMASGIDEHLAKPVSPDILIDCLLRHL